MALDESRSYLFHQIPSALTLIYPGLGDFPDAIFFHGGKSLGVGGLQIVWF